MTTKKISLWCKLGFHEYQQKCSNIRICLKCGKYDERETCGRFDEQIHYIKGNRYFVDGIKRLHTTCKYCGCEICLKSENEKDYYDGFCVVTQCGGEK